MRLSVVWLLALAVLTPAGAWAQSTLQLGGGYTHTPDGWLGAGAHALVAAQVASPLPGLRFRVEGFGSTSRMYGLRHNGTEFESAPIGTHALLGLGAGLQTDRASGTLRPYIFSTFNQYGVWPPSRPVRLELGATGGIGASSEWKGQQWFAEFSVRTFHESASKITLIWPLSAGVRF